jgi:integrase
MRGHIRQRGKSWVAIIDLDRTDGKRHQQWITCKSQHEAETKLTAALRERDLGIYVKPQKTNIKDFLTLWLAEYAKPNLTPRSYERYECIADNYLIPAFGQIHLAQLRPEHLQKHYAAMLEKGLSPRSVRYHHVVLHKALQTALKWGIVVRNVADGVDVPRAHPAEMQVWNEAEVHQFLEAAKGTKYYPLFYLSLYTGARRGELLALRWQDVDFIYSQIYINRSLHHLASGAYVFTAPKTTKSRRTIALPPSAFLVLEVHRKAKEIESTMGEVPLNDSDLVFSDLGKPWRPNSVSWAWVMLAAKAGVKIIRMHDARHTHASLLLKQGVHPKVVQERLGHSTIAVTLDIYSHVAPGLQEAAAKRFDDALEVGHNSNANEKELFANG